MRRAAAAIGFALLIAGTAPASAAEPFGSTPCSGVRPGARMSAPADITYTIGFVLRGTDATGNAANYVTTAGGWVLPGFGEKTWRPGTGPDARDHRGKIFGRFVYAVHTDTPGFTSFGLVRVDKAVKPNPQVCHFGGPTGLYMGTDIAPLVVQYYGQGSPTDLVAPARTGVVSGAADPSTALLQGAWAPGDEGAPVLVDGAILGYLDGGIGGGTGGAGFVVSRLGQWIAKAEKALKIKLEIVRAGVL